MSVWLLPENIADMLPREAREIERLRETFLKLTKSHGCEMVKPPMIEYVDSLLTGTGNDLDLRTFKIVDQSSGKMLGFRADMTPQIARIDAHILNREGISRLSYAGSLLHARPLHPVASRQPYVAGVELFGSTSSASDIEVLNLALECLRAFGLKDIHLDIGHVFVVKAIVERDSNCEKVMPKILYALKHKDRSALEELSGVIEDSTIDALRKIMRMFGGIEVLDEIEKEFSDYPLILQTIEQLKWIVDRCIADKLSFDFSDVHGYQYLTGITFGVTIPQRYQAVLRGGRYDSIGAKFGRNRPAVGFTLYLREIAQVLPTKRPYAVMAPWDDEDKALNEAIRKLREEGRIVVQILPEDRIESLEESFRLDEELIKEDGEWKVVRRYTK